MIAVLMGDKNCRDIFRLFADLFQRVCDPLAGDPRVDQHAGTVGSDIYAVSAAPAGDTVKIQMSLPSCLLRISVCSGYLPAQDIFLIFLRASDLSSCQNVFCTFSDELSIVSAHRERKLASDLWLRNIEVILSSE